jgi:hypothetical protein
MDFGFGSLEAVLVLVASALRLDSAAGADGFELTVAFALDTGDGVALAAVFEVVSLAVQPPNKNRNTVRATDKVTWAIFIFVYSILVSSEERG